MPNVAALNRREFLKFESMYQVKEEQPKPASKAIRRLRNDRLIEIYGTNPRESRLSRLRSKSTSGTRSTKLRARSTSVSTRGKQSKQKLSTTSKKARS